MPHIPLKNGIVDIQNRYLDGDEKMCSQIKEFISKILDGINSMCNACFKSVPCISKVS